jgi:hypothetical protein
MTGSPSIVPVTQERDTYFVLDDLGGRIGRLWREAGEEDTDRAVLIRHLFEGQYANPIRIVAFNTAQGWSRDVTEEIARELWKCCGDQGEVPRSLLAFLDHHGR